MEKVNVDSNELLIYSSYQTKFHHFKLKYMMQSVLSKIWKILIKNKTFLLLEIETASYFFLELEYLKITQ